jgi:TetR/AcrR family transcriptional repressor of nem operon
MPWEKQFDVDEVLEKAMHAFWSRGYEATSMQDLVTRTGVNRGSLYATYRDKHALFLAALRMYDERQRRNRLADLEARYGPREAIRQLLLAFALSVSDKSGNRGCFLTNTALELAAHDREAGKIVAHAQAEIEAFFARMIRQGQKAGEIGPGVDSDETASGLLASLVGLAVLSRSRPEPSLMKAIVAEADRRLG